MIFAKLNTNSDHKDPAIIVLFCVRRLFVKSRFTQAVFNVIFVAISSANFVAIGLQLGLVKQL